MSSASAPPVFDIDMEAFWRDPYPTLKQLRTEAPIAFVPQLGGVVFTRRDDIGECEKNVEVFSSHQPDGLMNKLMGVNLMRKDGEAHARERKIMFPSVSPKTVRDVWKGMFENAADEILSRLKENGKGDLCQLFALPVSGEALKVLTGLTNITYAQMDQWSQAMIDGIANYHADNEVEARCHKATAAIDAAIDEMIPILKQNPNHSILSVQLRSDLPDESIRANIKLAISGGQNEPRDAIGGAIWALLTHPDEMNKINRGEADWSAVFEEYCRWISPIGMTPRRIARAFEYKGYVLKQDDKAFLMFASANRDEAHFENPEQFDISRPTSKSIPFGAGPHFCAGAWASRALVSQVALPKIFAELKNLRIKKDAPVEFRGWAFRGPLSLECEWDS